MWDGMCVFWRMAVTDICLSSSRLETLMMMES